MVPSVKTLTVNALQKSNLRDIHFVDHTVEFHEKEVIYHFNPMLKKQTTTKNINRQTQQNLKGNNYIYFNEIYI